jgi:CRP/FNR family transcriptional regulator, cyclic AMP receptor protein
MIAPSRPAIIGVLSHMQSKLWYLQNIDLFKEMTEDEMAMLDRITSMSSARKKEPIYLPGDPSRQVYLLKSGRIKISRITEEGKEITLALLKPGEIFGELEVLDDTPRDTLAEALDDAELCVIQRKDFLSMLESKPDLSIRLTKLIGFRLRNIESRIEELVFRDVPARLAHLLMQMAKEFGKQEDGGIRIGAGLTHQELANLIGSTRETVSATLGDFKRQGLLQLDGHSMIIVQSEKLTRLFSRGS